MQAESGCHALDDDGLRDPIGSWLQDQEDYLDGRLSYGELQHRNGERYRESLPICGSSTLIDSQRNPIDPNRKGRIDSYERRRGKAWGRMVIVSSLLFGGIGVFAFMLLCSEWLIAVLVFSQLPSVFIDALIARDEWRELDE